MGLFRRKPEPEPVAEASPKPCTLDRYKCRRCGNIKIDALRRPWHGHELTDIYKNDDGTLTCTYRSNVYIPYDESVVPELYVCRHCNLRGSSLSDVVERRVSILGLAKVGEG
jgi:hypothetical protein